MTLGRAYDPQIRRQLCTIVSAVHPTFLRYVRGGTHNSVPVRVGMENCAHHVRVRKPTPASLEMERIRGSPGDPGAIQGARWVPSTALRLAQGRGGVGGSRNGRKEHFKASSIGSQSKSQHFYGPCSRNGPGRRKMMPKKGARGDGALEVPEAPRDRRNGSQSGRRRRQRAAKANLSNARERSLFA